MQNPRSKERYLNIISGNETICSIEYNLKCTNSDGDAHDTVCARRSIRIFEHFCLRIAMDFTCREHEEEMFASFNLLSQYYVLLSSDAAKKERQLVAHVQDMNANWITFSTA